MDSVEGKSNKAGIRWKGQTATVEWSGLQLEALITAHDPVILHGLNSKVKYVRLVRRKVSERRCCRRKSRAWKRVCPSARRVGLWKLRTSRLKTAESQACDEFIHQ